jgi:two-component system, OmpR family, sensor histidine kinase ChvG
MTRLLPSRLLARVRTSRIGLRVLAFNLLLVFLPVAGILYLDVYESAILEAQERGMIEQARLVAAALGGADELPVDRATALVARFAVDGDVRVRVYGASGALVADSWQMRTAVSPDTGMGPPEESIAASSRVRQHPLYRVGARVSHVRSRVSGLARRLFTRGPAEPARDGPDERTPPSEVRTALGGRYGAATRPTPGQRSLTLNSALPIAHEDRVTGAVVVSQSTFRILQALYAVRLRIFSIVIASVALAGLLSVLMSTTIVRPLVLLRRAATALAERRMPLGGAFRRVDRRDEIGDLARALDDLAQRLDAHIHLLESFSADVSHEFRNPLASIRTAAEMLVAADRPEDRQRFFAFLTKDIDRLERLVAGVRELARIDAELAQNPAGPVDVGALLSELAEGIELAGRSVVLDVSRTPGVRVRASRDHLVQVFDNILRNAAGFSPDAPPEIAVDVRDGLCVVSVCDRGPGIPEAHLARIFDRFFTYRPQDPGGRREHAGLGLAIARAIVEGHGGTITARNREGGGACFEVRLPRARADEAAAVDTARQDGPVSIASRSSERDASAVGALAPSAERHDP